MKVPTVSKFCYVFDLNVGGLMLGYLGAISTTTFTVLLIKDLIFDMEKFKHEVFGLAEDLENMSPPTRLIDELVHPTPIDESNVSTTGEEIENFINLCRKKNF